MNPSSKSPDKLRCVVQLGFAGSRRLIESEHLPDAVLTEIQGYLTSRLAQLPKDLDFDQSHFLCGISSLAAGADTLFTRACKDCDIPQRIFLPQPRDDFFKATNSSGRPDFNEAERDEALELLNNSPHIIHERLVSHADKRESRFEDVNLAIARASDVVVCLFRADAQAKPGGAQHLLKLAKKRCLPALEIRVVLRGGKPTFEETWHDRKDYTPPKLPAEIKDMTVGGTAPASKLPRVEEYCGSLKTFASGVAKGHRKWFRYFALVIILTHLVATVLATFVLASHSDTDSHSGSWLACWLLGGELLFLGAGFVFHQYLLRSRAAKVWAFSRLVAEITRSIGALGKLHLHLQHLDWLPLPPRLQPLLRTLDVLYLRSTRQERKGEWKPLRDKYVEERLDKPASGQIDYYTREQSNDNRRLKIGTVTFIVCSLLAMLATLAKLGTSLPGSASETSAWLPGILGFFAIVMPVVAIGALSYVAAMDSAARSLTYEETLQFLKQQRPRLIEAESFREFASLLLETESRLLGETASWYHRRSVTAVNE